MSDDSIDEIINIMRDLRSNENEKSWLDEYAHVYIQYRNEGNYGGHQNVINPWKTAKSGYSQKKQRLLYLIGL